MAKKEENNFYSVIAEIRKKNFAPIYLLMGEEPYFIDIITQHIIDLSLDNTERDFNQTIIYGIDTTAVEVSNACKRYPMMAERQLVVVKEAQNIKKLDELVAYIQQPLKSTILVLCFKGGNVNNKPLIAASEKKGVVFRSTALRDYELPAFITSYLKERNIRIEDKAVMMLAEAVGSDLSRMIGEINKLLLVISSAQMVITPDLIEEHIGISKEYNNFELITALVNKDYLKANRIQQYFEQNPKDNPIFVTIPMLFTFFSNLLIAQMERCKTDTAIQNCLGLKSIYQAREYVTAMRHYTATKSVEIITLLRTYDGKSKGVDNSDTGTGELMRELLFKIMH